MLINIVAIKDKEIFAQGKPEYVINESFGEKVCLEWNVKLRLDPLFGTPLCIPHGKGRRILKQVGIDLCLMSLIKMK